MRRDMDLVREILRQVEAHDGTNSVAELKLPDRTDKVVQYHLKIMHEAGLIDAIDISSMQGPAFLPVGLTWDGQDFLESARDETVWAKAKDIALRTTGGLALETVEFALQRVREGHDEASRGALAPRAGVGRLVTDFHIN